MIKITVSETQKSTTPVILVSYPTSFLRFQRESFLSWESSIKKMYSSSKIYDFTTFVVGEIMKLCMPVNSKF
jgi:hypothetical protein